MNRTNGSRIGVFPSASFCHDGEYFYMVCSSHQYFPGLPVYRSVDCLNWTHVGHCLRSSENFTEPPYLISPTIRFHNGTFYVTFTDQLTMSHFIVQSKDVADKWTIPAKIDCGGDQISLFFDGDNATFCTYLESNAIAICSIIPDIGQITSQPEIIYKNGEGFHPYRPHIYALDGDYAIVVRNASTDSRTDALLCKSKKVNGPYSREGDNHSLYDRIMQTTVHVQRSLDVVDTVEDERWIIYSEPDTIASSWRHLPPTTRVSLLDGVVPEIVPVDNIEALDDRDDFVLPELQHFWRFVGNIADDRLWSLEDRPGWIRLIPDLPTLSGDVAPLVITRKQEHPLCIVAAMLDFDPQQGQEEAGVTVYVDSNHHYEIAITRLSEGEQRSVIVRRRIGSLSAVVAFQLIPDGLVTLYVEATSDLYTFAFEVMKHPRQTLAEGETRYLSREVTGCESGVVFGVYATANGREGVSPAFFDWFDYIVRE